MNIVYNRAYLFESIATSRLSRLGNDNRRQNQDNRVSRHHLANCANTSAQPSVSFK